MTSIWKWENGHLQIKKSLLDGLQITETAGEVISVVGAGGKTTTIRRLTDEMEKKEKCGSDNDHKDEEEPQFYSVRMQKRLHKDGADSSGVVLENRMIIRKRSEVFQKRFWMR